MTYRRLALVFAVFVLHGTTVTVYTATPDLKDLSDEVVEIDGHKISRRGVISEIAEILDGVVDITGDVLGIILNPLKQLIKLDQYAVTHNPHKRDVATVRLGGPLCQGELDFRDQRFPVVKHAQERFLDMDLDEDDVLEIGFSCSGGGMRAKTYAAGVIFGASELGLLDAVMCVSGLSGGTWFLGPWISSGLDVRAYRQRALEDCVQGIGIERAKDLAAMMDALWVKFAYNQPINIIDCYGALLGNSFLRDYDKPQNLMYLSEQVSTLERGDFPLPVYTAILAERDEPNHWFELTPFEVGSRWLGAYIPAWAFGQQFKNGKSKDAAPEMSLGFEMGIFGSAFAASFEEAYEKALKDAKMPSFLKGVPLADKIWAAMKKVLADLALNTEAGELRLAWAEVFNYVYKHKQTSYSEYKDIKLADGGVYFNNPIFATYRKPPFGGAPDVVFVFDAGATIIMEELQIAADYARKNDLKFPFIDPQTDIAHDLITVFGDVEDLSVPLVIYMPRIVDQKVVRRFLKDPVLSGLARELKDFDIEEVISSGFAGTFNFDYTMEQAELLASLAEFNIRACEEQIKDLLQQRVAAKRAIRTRVFHRKGVHTGHSNVVAPQYGETQAR